jgi:uncharacterized membrane protein YccC
MMHSFDLQTLKRIGFAATIVAVGLLSLLPDGFMPHLHYSENAQHMLAYTVLTILGLMSYRGAKGRPIVIVTIISLGAALELAQLLTSSRSAEFGEFVFNCLGVMLGVVLVWIWSLLWPRLLGIVTRSAD